MLSLIPISDVNPTRRFPVITLGLIIANVLIYLQEPGQFPFSLGTGREATNYFYDHAPVPCQLVGECPSGDPFSDPGLGGFLVNVIFSTFLHSGILHIAGNMLFLWVFGNNIEDFLGRAKYVGFYLLGGLAASFAHIFWSLRTLESSPEAALECLRGATLQAGCHIGAYVPMVGASGAVAAVMGAYIVLYPRARVNVLVPIFIIWTIVQMSALAVLGIWLVYQFFIGAQELSGATEVAWMAHVGGFVFGVVAIAALGGRPHKRKPMWEPEWRY